MPKDEWQRRIERAQQLALTHAASAEILRFFAAITGFQRELWLTLESGARSAAPEAGDGFAQPLPPSLRGRFKPFLAMIESHGRVPLAEVVQDLLRQDEDVHGVILADFWEERAGTHPPGVQDFLARAFLQPYAVFVRSRQTSRPAGATPCLCPFCGRKPGVGVLRPQGEGGLRSLVCSFCLGEWEFRRILCPACGEEDHAKLPVYTAGEFPHVRVECCEACRCYIKTVDLTKTGLADPIVDEIASVSLDLWAQQQSYAKLQANLMQL